VRSHLGFETMAKKVFIDGEAGTTGLQIRSRLETRSDIELLQIPQESRKDPGARARLLNEADVAILCLPDAAAIEAVSLVENPAVKIVDASTAHRTSPDWAYGLPEMGQGQDARIAEARRVSNPGCYPTGLIALLRPLVEAGMIGADFPACCHAVSGYSGGGRALIARFEDEDAPDAVDTAYQIYALGLEHKHVEEMRVHSGLDHRPLFLPSVGRFYQGMLVMLPLQLWSLAKAVRPADLHEVLEEAYGGQRFVEVAGLADCDAMGELDPESLNGTNSLRLHVFGNYKRQQAVLVALLDNLGKGASGAAVQNLNLMLGAAPETGLLPTRLAAE